MPAINDGAWYDWVCNQCGHVTRSLYVDGRGHCANCQRERPGPRQPRQLDLFIDRAEPNQGGADKCL
jgi:hypothetical protein